jgi:hypothetical protein
MRIGWLVNENHFGGREKDLYQWELAHKLTGMSSLLQVSFGPCNQWQVSTENRIKRVQLLKECSANCFEHFLLLFFSVRIMLPHLFAGFHFFLLSWRNKELSYYHASQVNRVKDCSRPCSSEALLSPLEHTLSRTPRQWCQANA